MPVYVGPLFATTPTPKWPYSSAAHLYANNPQALHGFAANLGLKPHWAQAPRPYLLHYDLTRSMRRRALAAGAISLDTAAERALIHQRRREAHV